MCYKDILIFTDLDGTLLNKKSFYYDEAKDLIKNCIKNGVVIVPNSSKTSIELNEFCNEAEISPIYISENGSSIHGLNILNSKLNKKIILSRTKDQILNCFLKNVEHNFQKKCKFVEDLKTSEQIQILGLPKEKLAKALKRDFSIPMIFNGNENEKKQLKKLIKKLDMKVQDGGRVLNLGDDVSKGNAMSFFVKNLSKITNKNYTIIGIGDNENDISMLDKSDYPCMVRNGDRNIDHENRYLYSENEAPTGWIEVVKKTLNEIRKK